MKKFWLSAIFALALAPVVADPATPAGSAAAAPSAAQNSADAPLPVDPNVVVKKLPNGLTYYIRKNGKPENRAELRLVINAGAILEDEDQRGLAHFLEHMAFNGTKNFEKQGLIDYMQSIGMRFGADVNAYTSFDETVYMLQIPTDDQEIVDKGFQILEDWAWQITLSAEEIEKERGVVAEEWRLGRGASARIFDKQLPMLFSGSRYADRLPIGKLEVIENAPREAFLRFYRDWYRPDLMAVIVVGDFDTAEVEAKIKKHFGRIPAAASPRERAYYEVPDHKETLFSIETDPELPQSIVQIFYKHPSQTMKTEADFRESVVHGIAQNILNERLQERSQDADPPFIAAFTGLTGYVRVSDVFMQAALVKENGFEEGLTALLAEAKRAKQHGFAETELERQKVNILRSLERAYNERDKTESSVFAGRYLGAFLSGDPMLDIGNRLALYKKLLPGVSLDEVNRAVDRWISDKNRVVLVSAPEKEGLTPPTRAQLLALIDKAESLEVAAYEDKVSDAPLLAAKPKPGRVFMEDYLEEVDVYDWKLSNRARVVFKPTDFKNDEVRFSAFSPGGTSLAADGDYVPATTAVLLMNESGLGEFDSIELQKKLAGKVASASPSIGELNEGMAGSASPQDLETLFQLIYLHFTQPRAEAKAFESLTAKYKELVLNREKSPDTIFSDEVSKVLYQNHPRRQPLTAETIAEMDMDASLKFYRDRYADAGDFTFVFVGNVEPQRLKSLVAQYLGGLPNIGRKESWKDIGVKYFKGKQKIKVNRGLEPKSRVRMIFTGEAAWSPRNRLALNMLNEALRIRLREILREDMGGVYGVGVSGSLSKRPKERFSASVSFGCDPENVDKLTQAVLDELERAAKEGFEPSYLEKIKEIALRRYEVNLKRNSFWIANLRYYFDYGLDPAEILQYKTKLETVDNALLIKAARTYYDNENYLHAALYPEKKGSGASSGEPSE